MPATISSEIRQQLERVTFVIIKHRHDRSLSQKKLGEMAGIAENTIARLDAGDHFYSLSTLYKVAQALDISLEQIFHEAGL